jgi:hypothetical protein
MKKKSKNKFKIKISKEENTLDKLKDRGHFKHITGTGVHPDKKKYNRKRDNKIKMENEENKE